MKVLKIIVGIIVVVVILAVVYLMTLPSAYSVERTTEINAPSEIVMDHIANFKEWEAWSPWKAKDPDAKYTFEGAEGEIGSSMNWVTSLPDDQANSPNYIGEGGMKITELNGNESVKYELTFIKPWESSSNGGFDLSEENGVTTVRWYDSGELPFIMRPMGAMMDAMIGPDFESGLSKLKEHVESHAANAPAEPMEIEELMVEARPYISITEEVTIDQISAKLGEMYGKLGAFCGANQVEMDGMPFAIYQSWDGQSTTLEAAFAINGEVEGDGEIASGMTYAGPALKVTYMGPYEGTGAAHESIDAFMKENNREVAGAPWEVYVTDPGEEPDTSKWITEVYYPVK